jgi:hypothetical protein
LVRAPKKIKIFLSRSFSAIIAFGPGAGPLVLKGSGGNLLPEVTAPRAHRRVRQGIDRVRKVRVHAQQARN